MVADQALKQGITTQRGQVICQADIYHPQNSDIYHPQIRTFPTPKKNICQEDNCHPQFFSSFFGALFLAFSTYSKEDSKDGKEEVLDELVMEHIKQREAVEKVTQMVAERHSHGGDREVGQGRGEVGRALCFCYVKDSAEVTKEVVVMVVMKDATQEREVVDKVTKMAAELIFSVDAHISLTHSGGKPYECDQCKYSSKTAQNLKTHR